MPAAANCALLTGLKATRALAGALDAGGALRHSAIINCWCMRHVYQLQQSAAGTLVEPGVLIRFIYVVEVPPLQEHAKVLPLAASVAAPPPTVLCCAVPQQTHGVKLQLNAHIAQASPRICCAVKACHHQLTLFAVQWLRLNVAAAA